MTTRAAGSIAATWRPRPTWRFSQQAMDEASFYPTCPRRSASASISTLGGARRQGARVDRTARGSDRHHRSHLRRCSQWDAEPANFVLGIGRPIPLPTVAGTLTMDRPPSNCPAADWRNAHRSGPVTDSIGATRDHNSNYAGSYRRTADLACSDLCDHYGGGIDVDGPLRPRNDGSLLAAEPKPDLLRKHLVRPIAASNDRCIACLGFNRVEAAFSESARIHPHRFGSLHLPLFDLDLNGQARHSPVDFSNVSDLADYARQVSRREPAWIRRS
jgi:hypothetical protein